ncbi:MAG: efflux RND transporter periplasmic adaptor subunit, partial [Pseudomonadota bacterium]
MLNLARQTAMLLTLLSCLHAASLAQSPLASVLVRPSSDAQASGFDGVVEAIRQTVVAAQVSGTVIALDVKAGDAVKQGQVLLRIDARAANQVAAASDAQVQAARAALNVARQDLTRQQQLFQQRYISQAALDQAQAQFQSAQAQTSAQLAQASASKTQSDFFIVKAPYAGVVSEVPVTLGDMAMPGKTLVTLYDPGAMRVTASVPQTATMQGTEASPVKVQIPGLKADQQWIKPTRVQVLPAVDASTHTRQIRLDLPSGLSGLSPGMFARAWLPSAASTSARLSVPTQTLVKHAEMTGLYVINAAGKPLLRQVRDGLLTRKEQDA